MPAYLESSNPQNISLYERHGFHVTRVLDLPKGAPMVTAMAGHGRLRDRAPARRPRS